MRRVVSCQKLAAETATLIRADAAFYLAIALYTLIGLAFLHAMGATERVAYSIYPTFWLTLFGVVLPSVAVAVDLARTTRFDRKRSLAIRKTFSPSRISRFMAGMCLLLALMVFQGTFTSIKNGLELWRGGFPLDMTLADVDAWLHFGMDPWRWLTFAQTDPVRIAVEWNYGTLFFTTSLGGLYFVATSPLAASIRSRYLTCLMLVWILVGNVLAGLFMSAGPAFYGAVTGDQFRFAGLMEFLAHGASQPGSAAFYQAYLWALHTIGQTGFASGISAFPSVHVALATFNALFVWEYSRRLGIMAFAYAALIEASSVYLGWHYAIDGYAGALATVLIYVATRRMFATGQTRATRLSQATLPVPAPAAIATATAS
jgi:hypothetical protein